MLCSRLLLDPLLLPSHLRWNTVILAGGFHAGDEAINQDFADLENLRIPLTVNTIHLIGKKGDYHRESAMNLYDNFKKLEGGKNLKGISEVFPFLRSRWSKKTFRCEIIKYPENSGELPTRKKSGRALKSLYRSLESNIDRNAAFTWCFDFEGMLCDSIKETVRTGLKSGRNLFPEVFSREKL